MREWYLMTQDTRPNITGGFENDAFIDYKDDAFAEALESDIATTVILYNHDLSESQEIKCIIQGNISDTQLKSLERTALFSLGTVKAGMYVFFENRYWLVTGYPGTNGIYEKATLILCQYLLKWQNKSGDIIERWTNYTSASKYDVGENGNHTLYLTSNNYTVLITCDEETLELEGKRVFIDKNKKNPQRVFKITRNDDILYDYGDDEHGSILSLIADKTELNLQTDNCELMICDYIPPSSIDSPSQPVNPDETTDLFVEIIGDDTIQYGCEQNYIAKLTLNGEDIVGNEFSWKIISQKPISFTESGNTISIKIDDTKYIGDVFKLEIIVNNKIVAEREIEIVGIF